MGADGFLKGMSSKREPPQRISQGQFKETSETVITPGLCQTDLLISSVGLEKVYASVKSRCVVLPQTLEKVSRFEYLYSGLMLCTFGLKILTAFLSKKV